MSDLKPIKINGKRLQQLIDDFATIGKTEKGGVTRLALSDEDKEARDLFISLAQKAGCSIKIDPMGNIFARREGIDNSLEPVMIGSHIDSQPQGGRFDGIYGVLAGLEVIYTLNDQNIKTLRPVEVVSWTNEEGARFSPAMIGSAVFSGVTSLEEGWNCKNDAGNTIQSELKRIGYAGTDDFSKYSIYASLEIHIEQGPVLEQTHTDIGVVTGTFGQKWFEVSFQGTAAHAGTTPMDFRKDALLGMAKAIEAVHNIGLNYPDARATVGKIDIQPNSRNVVPGSSWFSVEFRHADMEILHKMEAELKNVINKISEQVNLSSNITSVLTLDPVYFHSKCINAVRDSAKKLGYTYKDMVSGAGHDSCNINQIAPTSMIFIPCIDGISHNEAEDILPEWGESGANVLLNSLLLLANEK